ncbi:Hypothetical protein HDN1F_16950 [gamma proteobacterium HdN1]|nr:Hypothetical protein HDN1F_16950 [gamma proteobacterium HdN1]
MINNVVRAGFACSAIALSISPAQAVDLRFDGFATFEVGQVLDDKELPKDLMGNRLPFRGFDDQINFQSNNVFALQARADLGGDLSATTQIIAKGATDYDAKFTWAYISYDLTPELTLSVGRFRIPYFIYSDTLDVGYSYHFIQPPVNTYEIGGFDATNGVKLEWQTDVGGWTSRATALTGRSDTELTLPMLSAPIKGKVPRLGLLTWSMNHDWFTARAIYAHSSLSIDFKEFLDSNVFNPIEASLAPFDFHFSPGAKKQVYVQEDKAKFYGVGFIIDPGPFFVIAEATTLNLYDSFMRNPNMGQYVSAGLRIGKFTPYITIENAESDFNKKGYQRLVGELPGALHSIQDQTGAFANAHDYLSATLRGLFNADLHEEDAYNLGLRYDFHPSAAFKIEYMMANDHMHNVKPSAIAAAVSVIF